MLVLRLLRRKMFKLLHEHFAVVLLQPQREKGLNTFLSSIMVILVLKSGTLPSLLYLMWD